MLRGALFPTLAAAAVCVVVAVVLQGRAGLVGSLLAAAVVVASFSSSLLVMRRTARSNPNSVMAAALVTYTTKIGLLGLMLVLLADAEWLSGTAFAGTAMLSAAVWLGFEVRAYARMRTLVFTGGGEQR
jgi:ATP synthase protein I